MSATIRRALLSVSNKEGLLEFARALRSRGVTILSTGGTAAMLREDGIEVTDVAAVTTASATSEIEATPPRPQVEAEGRAKRRRRRQKAAFEALLAAASLGVLHGGLLEADGGELRRGAGWAR